MKRQYIVCFCMGIMFFTVAFVVKPRTIPEQNTLGSNKAIAQTDADILLGKEELSKLQKITESLRAENGELQQKLELEKNARIERQMKSEAAALVANRYHVLMDNMIYNTPNSFYFPLRFNINFETGDLQPTDALIEFLGLEKSQVQELRLACELAFNQLVAFERDNATIYKDADGMLCYDIPPLPEEYTDKFAESIKAIIGEDDYDIISNFSLHDLEKNTNAKVAKIEPFTDSDGREMYRLFVQKWRDYDKQGGWRHFRLLQDYTVSKRWRHLFEIED